VHCTGVAKLGGDAENQTMVCQKTCGARLANRGTNDCNHSQSEIFFCFLVLQSAMWVCATVGMVPRQPPSFSSLPMPGAI
jgi:hypothetical protein